MLHQPTNAYIDIRTIFGEIEESTVKKKDNKVIDKDWITSRFVVPDKDMPDDLVKFRYLNTTAIKFTDTSIGGNIHINPKPQFNPLTDPRSDTTDAGIRAMNPGISTHNIPNFNPLSHNTGMGEGYSQLIDDNQQTVTFELGLPKFNSLIDFFFRSIDYTDSVLANTGRPSTFHTAGHIIGTAAVFLFFPLTSILIYATKHLLGAIIGNNSLKFYYFSSHMPMYWGIVNTLLTQYVTNRGLLSPMLGEVVKSKDPLISEIGQVSKLSTADIRNINEMIPGLISENTGYIDVFRIVTKAQRAALKQKEIINKRMIDGQIDSATALDITSIPGGAIRKELDRKITFASYLKDFNSNDNTFGDSPTPATPAVDPKLGKPEKFMKDKVTNTYKIDITKDDTSTAKVIASNADAAMRYGASFVTFAVDYTGPTTETFSNSVTSISLGDSAKQLAARSRSLTYDLARGNVFGDNIIQDATKAITDLAVGAVSGVTFNLTNVLATLTGNSYIEMPKRWEDSTMSFSQNNYKMHLVSNTNSFLGRLQCIDIPLFAILGTVIPLATGKNSYTSPMICTTFSRGIERSQLAMVTKVSLTRGTSNLGFDRKRHALAIDVNFTTTDFSPLVTVGVNSSIFDEIFTPTISDDSSLGSYISTLAARDLLTSTYAIKRAKIRLSQKLMTIEQSINTDRIGVLIGDSLSKSLLGVIAAPRDLTLLLK